MHFDGAGTSQPAPIVEAGASEGDTQLRQIVGPEPQLSYIKSLLLRFGGSVQRAAEAFFSDDGAPAPQPAGIPSRAAAPVLAIDASDSGEGGTTLQAVTRWLARTQQAAPAAPVPTILTSPRRSSFGRNIHPSRAQTARQAAAEVSSSSESDDDDAPAVAAEIASPEAEILSDNEESEPVFWTESVGHAARAGYIPGELRLHRHVITCLCGQGACMLVSSKDRSP